MPMRLGAALALQVLFAGQVAVRSQTGQCLVSGPSPGDPPLHLPIAGEDICATLTAHCGGGRAGAVCVKAALEGLLPRSAGHMPAIFARMSVPLEFYMLCSPPGFARALASGGGGAHVGALTAMLQRASNASHEYPRSSHAAQLLSEYQQASRWSELERHGWQPRDKISHFLDALAILDGSPDPELSFLHLHLIDRLATALDEAAAHERQGEVLLRKGRALLLHYAVLSELISHPLQRPLSVVRGLRASPWWPLTTQPSQAQTSPAATPVLLPWLAPLLKPTNLAAMQAELYMSGAGVQAEGLFIGGRWSEMHFIANGKPKMTSATAFPRTTAIIEESRRAAAADGGLVINARLSAVSTGTHITPHCGVSNAKLRAHIGLRCALVAL